MIPYSIFESAVKKEKGYPQFTLRILVVPNKFDNRKCLPVVQMLFSTGGSFRQAQYPGAGKFIKF